ncbi:LegC family aminotransferase [Bacillus alkalicellulosilyticus]|uniref:LegC family aminotransferase n=1 Tax=Alkalihalobacterium alkalicellulosilyticum TaxID=1912214 RepID=UPI0009967A5E|nr:LegC family aminotransferase [Bacillus alkalicellulosilyticus]
MITLEQKIENAIRSVIPNQEFTPLSEPSFKGKEWSYVKDCLDSTFVSSVGKYVEQFEENLAEYTGVKRAIAVVNGTAALHIALKIAGVVENDEVLIPSLTFVATANAVSYCNAIAHFVDCDEQTLGIDPFKLTEYLNEIALLKNGHCINKNTGRRIKAVVPMHTFGHSVNMDPLLEVCKLYKIELVEDAAESLGTRYKGRHTGSFGKAAALSFNGNKIITTGGGGAILTNDDKLADYAKHITTTAKVPHSWEYTHDEIGYNYRLPNINAAIGCAQLEQLPIFLEKRRHITEKYLAAFRKIEEVRLFVEPSFSKSNYWLQTILLESSFENKRDDLLSHLNNTGLMARPVWKALHQLEMYKDCPRMDLSVVEKLGSRIINIPSSF